MRWVLCVMLVWATAARAQAEKKPCAFAAHDGDQQDAADVCAEVLRALQTHFEQSVFKGESCPSWPNLPLIALGEESERVQFIPLTKQRWLLRVQCDVAAYNDTAFFFLYDETKLKPGLRGEPRLEPLPLLIFPNDPWFLASKEGRRFQARPYDETLFSARYLPKERELATFRKGLGDGTLGVASRYRIDPETGVPTLVVSVARARDDHAHPFDPSTAKEPSGPGWTRFTPKQPVRGCLATLLSPTCPPPKR